MGYLFPGILLIMVLLYILSDDFSIYNIFDFSEFQEAISACKLEDFNLDKCILLVILSYVAGHFISYLSSITIETMSNKVFGYPSEYLLYGNKINWPTMLCRFFRTSAESSCVPIKKIKTYCKRLLNFTNFLFLFPITTSLLTIGWSLDINTHITRTLDNYLTTSILKKQQKLATLLNLNKADVNIRCDYHRLVMHYVYLNIPDSQRKIDNYVALYGFLRAITLVFCLCFDLCFIFALKSIDTSLPVNWGLIYELSILYGMTCLSYLGFMKFYRRCTLENYMALITCPTV